MVFATLILPFSNAQFVEVEKISNVTVNAYWQTNGATNIDILSQQRLAVNLTQKSNVTSSALITATGNGVSIYPTENTETLAPNATETIYFTVSNGGGSQQVNNAQINVTSYETFTDTKTSSCTVTCNLLQTVGLTPPTLKIHVQDNSSQHSPIVGLQLQVQYPASTAEIQTTEFTDTNGVVSMNLATPAGGGYTGEVKIQTVETSEYGVSNTTTYVNSGQNDVTVTVPIIETQTPTQNPTTTGTDWQLIIEVIALVGFLAFLTVIAFVYVRSKNNRTPPPPP